MSATRDHSAVGVDSVPASQLVQQVIDRWGNRDRFDARTALSRNPRLRDDRSAVVTLALEEYCRLQEQGAPVSADRFVERFPEVRSTLRWHLALHSQLCADAERLSEFLAVAWPAVGDVVAGWRIAGELGRGGFSRVYLAREERIGERPVVVKFSNSSRDEAACVGRLDHPGIIRVLSVQPVNGLTAIAMPFLGRATLLDVIDLAFPQEGGAANERAFEAAVELSQAAVPQASFSSATAALPMSAHHVENVLHVGQRLCEALAYAHSQGVLHCDIKPSNVLIAATGAPILLDFNLAVTSDLDRLSLGGTLPYMSPEHLDSALKGNQGVTLDGRSDVFSLGVTLYQLLTGELPFAAPFDSDDLRAAAVQMQREHAAGFEPVRRRNPAVPSRTAALIERCLSARPEDRPGSMTELSAALTSLLCEQRPRGFPCLPRSRRGRLALAAGAAGGAILLATATPLLREPAADQSTGPGLEQASALLNTSQPAPAPTVEQAIAEMERDHFSAALSILEQLPQPEDPRILALQGNCHAHLEHWKVAIEFYDRVLSPKFEPASGPDFDALPLWNNLGYCYLKEGEIDDARNALKRATELDPAAPMPWANLAELDTRVGSDTRMQPSLESADTALNQGGGDAAVLAAVARAYAVGATLARYYHQDRVSREAEWRDACLFSAGRAIEAGYSTQLIKQLRVRYLPGASEFDALAIRYGSYPSTDPGARHSQLLPVR